MSPTPADLPQHYFTDLVTRSICELVVPVGGAISVPRNHPEIPKIGIRHTSNSGESLPDGPACDELADLSIDLDAFYCPSCGRSGRVSGAWCVDVIESVLGPEAAL